MNRFGAKLSDLREDLRNSLGNSVLRDADCGYFWFCRRILQESGEGWLWKHPIHISNATQFSILEFCKRFLLKRKFKGNIRETCVCPQVMEALLTKVWMYKELVLACTGVDHAWTVQGYCGTWAPSPVNKTSFLLLHLLFIWTSGAHVRASCPSQGIGGGTWREITPFFTKPHPFIRKGSSPMQPCPRIPEYTPRTGLCTHCYLAMIIPQWSTANHGSRSGYGVGTRKFRSRFPPDDEPIKAYLLSVNTREDVFTIGTESLGHKCLKLKKQIHLKNTAPIDYFFHFKEVDTEIWKVDTKIKRLPKGHRQSVTMAMLLVLDHEDNMLYALPP